VALDNDGADAADSSINKQINLSSDPEHRRQFKLAPISVFTYWYQTFRDVFAADDNRDPRPQVPPLNSDEAPSAKDQEAKARLDHGLLRR
jgi:hypothetical protein